MLSFIPLTGLASDVKDQLPGRRMGASCMLSCEARSRSRQAEDLCRELRIGVVENTGLEPVTSWLQTRRSPS